LAINDTTPKINIDIHGVKIGAGFCGENFAANEAGIENKLFLGAMLENLFDANWTIEIHDLFKKGGMCFNRLSNRLI
jgi:hypothetical protein